MRSYDPAGILLRAACAIRRSDVVWGRGEFLHHICGTRCALGAIAYAADPDNPDGDPFFIDGAAQAALAFARWLVDEGHAVECRTEHGQFDPVETVGGWNDSDARSADEVWRALSACAAHLDEKASSRFRHPAGSRLPEHLRTEHVGAYLRQKGEVR